MEEEDIVWESCSRHTKVVQTCEWCKIATWLETMLEDMDMSRSEKIEETAEHMAGLMD